MEMDLDDILLDAEERMEKTVEVFRANLRSIRTGRANAGMVESLKVSCYGAQSTLKQLATIGVPDPQMIVIKPFDPTIVQDIEKAIQTSDLGLNPQTDKRIIRLVVPPLSEERRRQLVVHTKDMAEEMRVAIRNVRRDANKSIDKIQKAGQITEDDRDGAKDDVQKLTSDYETMVNELLEEKTKELMDI